jgi:uncharacterized protein YajQ (UPF0234 family)
MPSFDIVSEVNMQEVDNAVNQAQREIATRFDFKNSKAEIVWDKKTIKLSGEDEFRVRALAEIVQAKLAKRGVSLKNVDFGKMEVAAPGSARQEIQFVQGISAEKAKPITQAIRHAKFKVTAQIQDGKIRVSGKSRDELQAVIAFIRGKDFGRALSFNNFRE